RLLAANPAAVELLGGAPHAAGEPAATAAGLALAAHPALAGAVSTAIADGRSIARASVAIERAGRRVELGWTLQALRPAANKRGEGEREGAGGGAGFLVLFADVTDLTRRETEERFATGLAQLGELSAGVAHELRNSLATVQGYLALAARRELPDEAREEIAEARREASELERIVDDFLTFARPGRGAVEPVDLAALLLRATHDPALGAVPFELVTSPVPLPPIAGDPHLLQRALRNLLLNAAQATLRRAGAGGSTESRHCEAVVVGLSRDGDDAMITIDDRGSGISPQIRDRLFEPFASGRAGGAGLGLALARRIVLMHGGGLELRSREPYGTRAAVRLPLGESVTVRNERGTSD
ncbi:MAG: ATP-binding protein, partial [Thermoanaerobaculia bacterium]